MSRYLRIALTAGLLGGAVLAAGWFFLSRQPEVTGMMQTPARRPPTYAEVDKAKFGSLLPAVIAAEQIADPGQRCLQYPNPPDVDWSPELVTELCRVTTFEYVSLDDIAQRLAAGDATGVDRIFDDYATRDGSDPQSHGIWIAAVMHLFGNDTPKAGQVAEQWVKKAPRSAHALVARAAFEVERGYSLRGVKTLGDTPPQSLEAMEQTMQRAMADLQAAIKLDPKSKPAWLYLILAQKGDAAATDEAARKALALDPIDDVIYMAWLESANPHWDSTPHRLESILADAQPHRAQNPLLVRLEARAEWFRQRDCCQDNRSQPNYLAALRLAPDQSALRSIIDETLSPSAQLLYASQRVRFQHTAEAYLQRRELWPGAVDANQAQRLGAEDLASARRVMGAKNGPSPDVATALIAEGKTEEAAAEYHALLTDNPRNIDVIEALIDLDVSSLNRRDEARKFATILTELQPGAAETWWYVAQADSDDLTKYCEAVKRYHAAHNFTGIPLPHEDNCKPAEPGHP